MANVFAIENLTVLEMSELVKAAEEKFSFVPVHSLKKKCMTSWMNMRTSKKHVSVHGDQLRVNSCQIVFLLISVEKLLRDGLGNRSNTVNP